MSSGDEVRWHRLRDESSELARRVERGLEAVAKIHRYNPSPDIHGRPCCSYETEEKRVECRLRKGGNFSPVLFLLQGNLY
jgi:hypothetical protein